jgi:hypothetical protein
MSFHITENVADENGLTEKEIQEKFSDRKWRLNNLYHIRDSSGRKILFKMNEVQEFLHDNLWYRNVIPKARKLGISTFFSILNLDQILFSENKTAGIVAHRQEDMKKLFRNTILFSVENLHPWMKSYIGKPDIATANELTFKNGGNIFVSMTTRGNTPQFLHVSELGYISKHAPDKAAEIVSGAINSVAIGAGNVVSIESTADNGRNGPFYDICMSAEKLRITNSPLTELDWKIFFFGWFLDPQYQLHNAEHVEITADMAEYFRQLEKAHGIHLTDPQKRWYVKAKETNREEMFVQFPSTLDEAFSVSLEGAYYGKDINAVYADNRVGFFPVDPTYPVDVTFDLGMNDSTVMLFSQSIGPEIRWVDFYESSGVGLEHYVGKLREKGYRYGKYILPHDVQVRDLSTGVSRLQTLWDLGLRDTIVAPKVFISDGIEKVRMLFRRFRFDKEKAASILNNLQTYRKSWDEAKGVWSDAPFHGPESHTADAVRTFASVYTENFAMEEYDFWGDKVADGGIKIESFF